MRGPTAGERSDQRVHVTDGPELVDRPFPAAPSAPLPFQADLAPVRSHTRIWAMEHELPLRTSDDLVLAVDELAANSVSHGGGHGELRLWSADRTVVAEVSDQGWIRDPTVGQQLPPMDQADGRGLWIANAVADRLQIHSTRSGTAIRAHFLT